MSREIEQRVVEMRFDNEQFEKNAQQSLSTLEKLKNALSFKGAKDGLKGIDEATRNVNMTGLANSVDTVSARFSALQIVGYTALATITNKAVDAGMALVKNLSVDQVTAGWSKYADKTTAVQTIMAATANAFSDTETQMAAVNEQLEKLSWFTDETSYNFVDMVSNIGKFTSNNIGLEESVTSMQGIATWAAISGANATEASRAMYNLSQAIGVGAVTAVDWRSIENANMATAEFKQTVIETAEGLGTLKKNADGTYETLEGNLVSIANFREYLSDKWFTNDVLTKALDKYGSFTTKLNEAFNETGKLTSEILDDIADYKKGVGDYANITEDASASSKRYAEILKELSSDQYDFGRKAFQAAQETKTFAEVIDYTKDAVSSQWMGIFEAIFGDYTNAKKLWTGMSEDFYTLFVEPLENVRGIVENAFGSKWDALTEKITGAGLSMSDFEDNLRSMGKLGTKTLDELIEEYGSLEAAIASGQISRGFIRDAIEKTIDKALKMGAATEEVTQSIVNLEDVVKRVIHGEFGNGQARIEALTKAGYDYATVQDMVNKTLWHQAVDYNVVSEAQLKSIGYTDEQIEKIKELQREARTTGSDLNELLKQVQKPSGRQLFTESLQNSLQIIIRSIQLLKDSWNSVFNGDASSNLYRILEAIHSFTENTLARLDKNSEKISRTFKGLFNVLDLAARLLKGAFRTGVKLVNKVLSRFNMNIWDVTAAIGDWLTHIHDVILGNAEMSGTLDTIIGSIAQVIVWIIKFVKNIGLVDKARSIAEKMADRLKKAYAVASDFFKDVGKNIETFVSHWKELDHLDLSTLGKMLTDFKETVIKPMFQNLLPSEESFGVTLTNYIKESLKNVDIKSSIGNSSILGEIVDGLKKLKDRIFNEVGLSDIFTAAIIGTDIYAVKKIVGLLSNFSDFTGVLSKVGTALAGTFKAITGYFKNLKYAIQVKMILHVAEALGIFVAALIALAYVPTDRLQNGIKYLGELAAIMAGLALAVGLMNKLSVGASGLNALGLIGVSIAIGIMAKIVKQLSVLTFGEAAASVGVLAAIMLELIGFMKLLSMISKTASIDPKSYIGLIGLIGVAFAFKIVVESLSKLQRVMDGINFGTFILQIGAIMSILALIALVTRIASKNAWSSGVGILAAVTALYMLVSAINMIKDLDVSAIKANISAFIVVFGMFIGLMAITKLAGENAAKGGAGILMMSIAVMVLLESINMLTKINNRDLMRGLVAIAVIFKAFAVVIAASKFAGKNAIKAGAMLIMMSAAFAILVGSMYLLTVIAQNEDTFKRALGAMLLIGAIMVAIIAVSKVGSVSGGALAMLGVLIGVVTAIAGALYILASIEDQSALESATKAMAVVMAMFALMEVCSLAAGKYDASIGAVAILLGVVYLLAGVLAIVAQLPVESTLPNAEALALLMVAFSASMFILSKIGIVGPLAIEGLTQLAVFLGLVSGIMLTIGAIVASIPGSQAFIDQIVEVLTGLGEAIGGFFGGAVGGFIGAAGEAISKSFIRVCENLSTGINALKPALEGLSGITGKNNFSQGIKAISEMVLALGAADFMNACSNLLGGGVFSKIFGTTFADKIASFGEAFNSFPSIDSGKIKSAQNAAKAGKALVEFANEIPNEGGLLGLIIGENSDFKKFGEGMAGFATAIGGIATPVTDDTVSSMTNLADCGKALAEFAENMPNEGGKIAKWIGDNNKLGQFGFACAQFARAISGIDPVSDDDKKSLTNLAEAGTAVADFAKKVSKINTDGAQNGSTYGLKDIGSEMKAFATAISQFPQVTEADATAIGVLPGIFDSLALVADTIYQRQAVFNGVLSDGMLSSFVEGIGAALPSIQNLDSELANINFGAVVENIQQLSDVLTSLLELIQSITGNEGAMLTQLTGAFVEFGRKGISAFADGLAAEDVSGNIIISVQNMVDNAVAKMADSTQLSKFDKAGTALIDKFKSAIDNYGDSKISSAFTSKLSSAVAKIRQYRNSFYKAGEYLGDGLVKGIESKTSAVIAAGQALGKAAANAVPKGAQENSPSKITIKAGQYIGEGLIIGMSDYFDKAASTGEYLAKNSLTAMASALSDVGSIVDSNLDVHPTISPVIDRTAITSELSTIGTMFSQSKASVLSANISGQMDANNVVLDYISKLDAANASRNTSILDKFDKLSDDILTLGERIENLELTLDGDKLVGGIAKRADRALGTRAILDKRGL